MGVPGGEVVPAPVGFLAQQTTIEVRVEGEPNLPVDGGERAL